jgi:hypothetical protein
MSETKVQYIARGNHGTTLIIDSLYPRKALCDRFGRSHADRIYVDTPDGRSEHIGYFVAGEWFTLYHIDGRGIAPKARPSSTSEAAP